VSTSTFVPIFISPLYLFRRFVKPIRDRHLLYSYPAGWFGDFPLKPFALAILPPITKMENLFLDREFILLSAITVPV
jgi:hypothetical protein